MAAADVELEPWRTWLQHVDVFVEQCRLVAGGGMVVPDDLPPAPAGPVPDAVWAEVSAGLLAIEAVTVEIAAQLGVLQKSRTRSAAWRPDDDPRRPLGEL